MICHVLMLEGGMALCMMKMVKEMGKGEALRVQAQMW